MSKKINISVDSLLDTWDKINNYFSTLPQDELGAWIAIAAGFFLVFIGTILL